MLDIDDSTTCVPEDATICVPEEFFGDNFEPKTFQDVLHIFNIFQYWGARIRAEFYESILSNPSLRSELAIPSNSKILEEKFPDFEDTDNMVLFMETSDMYELACKATRYDSEELFMGVMKIIDPALIDTELWNCAAQGSIVSLMHLHDVCQMAYENGSYHEFMWPDETTCESAAKVGNVDALRHLQIFSKCNWDARTMMAAAFHGHVNVLEYAYVSYCPCDLTKSFTYDGYTRWTPPKEIFEEFIDQSYNFWYKCGEDVPITLGELAASNGNTGCLRFLYARQEDDRRTVCEFNPLTFTAAFANGHYDCVEKVLVEWYNNEVDYDQDDIVDGMPYVIAALRNDLVLFEVIQKMEIFPLDGLPCLAATTYKNMDSLVYLSQSGLFLNRRYRRICFITAIREDDLQTIILLHSFLTGYEEDEELDYWFCAEAASYNCLSILKFLMDRDYMRSIHIIDYALESIINNGEGYECLEYADKHGCPWSLEAIEKAAICGYVRYELRKT
jgi:hypothetical protein